jgi:hypothetical protein
LTISTGDKEASKRKKTEGKPRCNPAASSARSGSHHSRGWKPQLLLNGERARNKGCRAHNGKPLNTDPSFMKEKVYAKAQLQGKSFKFSQALA